MNEQLEHFLSYIKYCLIQYTGVTNILDVITISMMLIGSVSILITVIIVYDLNTTNCSRKQKSNSAVIFGFTGYFLIMIGFIYWF